MKKLFALLLIFGCLLPTFAACSDDSGDNSSVDTTADAADTTAAEGNAELTNEQKLANYVASLPDNDYEGYEFVILTRSDAIWQWETRDVFSEGEDGEPINDAVYQRNRLMEEKFNIVVKDNPTSAYPNKEAMTLINSGEDSFAFLTDGLSHLANMAVAGMAIDYNEVDTIILENEWWDQRMNEEMSIAHHLYTITGDISIMDNEGTWNLLFNKDIQNDLGLTDYYELRDNGTWTLDVLITDAQAVSADLNGDGKMNNEDSDRFGLSTEPFNTYAFWAGAGLKSVTKNSDDIPEYSMFSEKSATVIDRVLDIQNDDQITFNHNGAQISFGNGISLFYLVGMRVLPTLRDKDVDFGILPIPKYEEAQDRYYSFGSHTNVTAYLMPITTSDVDRSGTLIEAMAGMSLYTLTPAYYEISLMGKMIRDDESAESLEIILHNRSYDLGVIFSFGSPTAINLFTKMNEEKARDFASRCAAQEPSMVAAIEEFVESLK